MSARQSEGSSSRPRAARPARPFTDCAVPWDSFYSDSRINVAELTGCIRKAWFRRRLPLAANPGLLAGHASLGEEHWRSLLSSAETRVTHRVRGLVETCVICGWLDLIDGDTACRFKAACQGGTSEAHHSSPDEVDLDEVKACAWLGGYRQAKLVYVSSSEVTVFDIELGDSAGTVERMERLAKALFQALTEGQAPSALGSKRSNCKECEYSHICTDCS